ncbi:MAG: CrcB family protein [Actinomycetia bacterium]|nr:CrcB family protein [Actinomycetes bacterium]MCP3912300.1 CrcB family protein [Actinomycetes bacterium]MCP4087425.1 CrcB family protein [Actinomycetes bacterium]
MITAVLFAVAAAAGGVLRALASTASASARFRTPVGTLVVNVGAAFAAGLATGLDGPAATVVSVGLLGALSTFSTLVRELVALSREAPAAAGVYLVLTVSGGLAAAGLGLALV